MPVTYELMKSVAAQLFDRSLRKITADTKTALQSAVERETDEIGRKTLLHMLESADLAEKGGKFLCSDAGIPVYVVRVGTRVQFEGKVRQAIADGFHDLVDTIDPPMSPHVANPLTNARGYGGRNMPIVTFDLVDDADYVEMICSPKALATGRWASLEVLSFPTLAEIEKHIFKSVMRAGTQACSPFIVGVGIGGTIDCASKMAEEAILRPIGQPNPEPVLADMESRLLKAVNEVGFGAMGTGGNATALALHIDYSAGHAYTPVAVTFNCWINRRTRARIYNNGEVVYCE